jgi:hypothetical protein
MRNSPCTRRSKLRLPVAIAISFLVTQFVLPLALGAGSSSPTTPTRWPKNQGVYIAASSETIPPFSRALSGYRPAEDNKDFWDRSFASKGSIRIFEGRGWTGIPNFPATMNGCSSGVFMIRWRSASSDIPVVSTLGYYNLTVGPDVKPMVGMFGYMYSSNCEQPMFKVAGNLNGSGSTLVDVYYELKFWQAAP